MFQKWTKLNSSKLPQSYFEVGSHPGKRNFLIPLVIALGLIISAILLRIIFIKYVGEIPPYMIFIPVIIIIALLSGFWLGIISTFVFFIITDYWLVSPGHVFTYDTMTEALSLGIFLLIGVAITFICEFYRRQRLNIAALRYKQAIYDNQQRLSLALDAVKAGWWQWDIQKNEAVWSAEIWPLCGLKPGSCEPSYDAWLETVHPDDRPAISATVQTAVANSSEMNLEWKVNNTGNELRWLMSRARPLFDENGKAGKFIGIVLDVTDQKLSQQALSQSEQRYRNLVEMSPNAIFINRKNTIVYVNPSAVLLFGATSDKEIIGKSPLTFFHPDYHVMMSARIESALAGKTVPLAEQVLVRLDGTLRTVEVGATVYEDHQGRALQVIMRDVTERKVAETALRKNEQRLSEQTKELEAIIGIVSHDLRAPLVNVRGFNNFLKQDVEKIKSLLANINIPPDVQKQLKPLFEQSIPESIGFIDSSSDAMNTLVKLLVEVARAGLVVLNPQPLDMNHIVRSLVANLSIKFKEQNARITIEDLPSCRADQTQVTQIFTNLIDNAVKYLSPDRPGLITVSATREKEQVIYCVSDNGIGIDRQDQQKIFEIFTRLAQKSHAGGEGMGLTMVRRMVEHNNGRLWLQSEKNKGSKFFVALPAA